ncbi:twin-arginine translocase TatA/TatE family subunit [Stakelama saccharophila]|uniref:Sec-independent protein translocase protein TatA n=1 Tax=Stakelama saccharophila TaxID=3075605 RepID=A0ABZ0BBU4_9SPHN|nr:twin-arginine translocase TatA/TatE family subunit [Stakelama sp. W311]WNO54907.1 twin-arginine translocase TatA/TatE family subunit [Stakelama sp. W311]
MGSFSLVHWLVLAIVAVLLLGGGRFSNLMGDVAQGIKNFKKGMADDEEEQKKEPSRIDAKPVADPDASYDREARREER